MGKTFPTQKYDVPSIRIRKRFDSEIAADIYGIQGRKWNSDRVIIYQTVILKRARLVTSAKNICVQINNRLD